MREAKIHYKNKINENFTTGNVQQAWDGLNIMMGRNDKRHNDPPITIPINDMNNYFNRFDTEVCSLNCKIICQTIPYCSPQLDVVARILFLDFTSAFNTMRVDILLERLISLGVNRCLVLWIKDFVVPYSEGVV